jgi:hypothetical protein
VERVDQPKRDLRSLGLVVFAAAVLATAALVWLGVSDTQWPRWLLVLTTVL